MIEERDVDLEDWIFHCCRRKDTVNNYGFLVKNRFNSTLLED